MTAYGHEPLFGALLEPSADRPQDVLLLADVMEETGLDIVSLSDHPYWPQRLDTFVLLSAIAARTSRIRVLSNLANLPLRPPPVLARTAATLDIVSGGRFELGIGTGAQQMWESIVAEGGPVRNAPQSMAALREAVTIIRALWAADGPESGVQFEGEHYRVNGARPGPPPAHPVPIWFGAYQTRMLRMTGELADAWVPSSPFMPPEYLPSANKTIDEAALAAGRSPADIRRAYNIEGTFGDGAGFLQGPPRVWAEQLADVALNQGMSSFLLYRATDADFIRRFAAEVAPHVRELVAVERGGAAG